MKRLVFAFVVALTAVGASAQTPHEHDACARDVTRFCRAVMNNGDSAVLACLQQNRQRISRACNKVLTEHGQ